MTEHELETTTKKILEVWVLDRHVHMHILTKFWLGEGQCQAQCIDWERIEKEKEKGRERVDQCKIRLSTNICEVCSFRVIF